MFTFPDIDKPRLLTAMFFVLAISVAGHLKGVKKVRSVKNSKFSFNSDLLIFLIFSAVADMNWYC